MPRPRRAPRLGRRYAARLREARHTRNPTAEPHDGVLRPDRSRPGLGLEEKAADAERYRVR